MRPPAPLEVGLIQLLLTTVNPSLLADEFLKECTLLGDKEERNEGT